MQRYFFICFFLTTCLFDSNAQSKHYFELGLNSDYFIHRIKYGDINFSNAKSLNISYLQFASIKNAIEQAINAANVNTLCSGDMFLHKTNGHLTLRAFAKEEGKHNVCVQGLVDLIDGNTSVTDIKCRQ